MIRLRGKDIEKLSAITGVSVYDIEKLSAMGVVDHSAAVDLLIASDWKRLKGRYTTWQLTKAMMEEYSVSKTKIQNAMYRKKKNYRYCSQCGKRISKSVFDKNSGKCNDCISKNIEL